MVAERMARAEGSRNSDWLISEIFANLSPPERDQFSAVLTKLMRAMNERQGEC